jgi:FAD/FMN-containing dehydrogenase
LQSEIEVKGIFMGTLAEMGDALEPMLAVPGAVLTVNEMPFSDFYHLTTPPEEPFLKYSPMVAFKLYPSEALQIIHDFVANAPSAKSNFFSVAFGCATRHLPEGGAAVPFGKAHMYTECGAEWSNPAITTQALNWVQSFRLAMLPFFNGGYVNVLCQEIAEYEEQYYLKNARRLRSVKKRYDPQNVFYFEQSIAET